MTKITIQGTAPQFNAQTLKQRQAARHNQYHLTSESFGVARGEIAFEFLTNVIELVNQGYKLSDKYPVATDPRSYHCHMRKPDAIQTADLKALDEEVKQKYITDLELERERYRQLVTAQLLQKAELSEAKKVADKQAKLLADVQKEVNELFGELVVPA